MKGGGKETHLCIVPKLALKTSAVGPWVLPSSTPPDCIPTSDTLKRCFRPRLHWKQSHRWPEVPSSLSGVQPFLHQTVASPRNPNYLWLSSFPKQKAHDRCCLVKPLMGWLNHGETISLPTWMGKVHLLEPRLFPCLQPSLEICTLCTQFGNCTFIGWGNARSSPRSRRDGSQSSWANTNLGSLTSHVCLLAAGGIATGSPPKTRPKLITKCAALSVISQWFLFSFAYTLF